MGQKVTIRFWWKSGLSPASRKHLTTFCRLCPLHMFKIVFRHNPLYPKQSRAYARAGALDKPTLEMIFYKNFITRARGLITLRNTLFVWLLFLCLLMFWGALSSKIMLVFSYHQWFSMYWQFLLHPT